MTRPSMHRRLRAFGLAVAAAGLMSLAGCGFTPLYGDNGMGASLDDVAVKLTEHSRLGFLLGERLNDALGRHGDHASWTLELSTESRRVPRGLRVNNVASRYELTVTVDMVLKDAASGKVALKDTLTASATYDSADQPYSGLAAEQDGEARAAAVAADLVRLRLSRYFATRPTP